MRTERAVQLHSSAMAVDGCEVAIHWIMHQLPLGPYSSPAPHEHAAYRGSYGRASPPVPLAHCHQMDLIHIPFKWSCSKRRRHMIQRGSTDEAGVKKAFAHDAHHASDADGTFCHCEAARPDDIRDRRL